MQPLDTSVFAPLKVHWRDACHNYMQCNPGRVITKYQFTHLFAQAWFKTMIPATITSGFKSCGVYLFDPQVILSKYSNDSTASNSCSPCSASCTSTTFVAMSSDVAHGSNATNFSDATDHFTAEEEERFRKRFEEGYDLFDPCYLSWLKSYHPDSLPEDDNGLSTALTMGDMADSPTLTEFFPSVPPCEPSSFQSTDSVVELSCSTGLPKVSSSAHTPLSPSSTALTSSPVSQSTDGLPPFPLDQSTDELAPSPLGQSTPALAPSPLGQSTAPLAPSPLGQLSAFQQCAKKTLCLSTLPANHISKYLVQYVPATPTQSKCRARRVTGERVLTSAEALAILKDKEEKN